LVELWLGRNRISQIENLEHLGHLQRMSLQSNRCVSLFMSQQQQQHDQKWRQGVVQGAGSNTPAAGVSAAVQSRWLGCSWF
jgi:hypothetical protein